jgi:hypothetical protein
MGERPCMTGNFTVAATVSWLLAGNGPNVTTAGDRLCALVSSIGMKFIRFLDSSNYTLICIATLGIVGYYHGLRFNG